MTALHEAEQPTPAHAPDEPNGQNRNKPSKPEETAEVVPMQPLPGLSRTIPGYLSISLQLNAFRSLFKHSAEAMMANLQAVVAPEEAVGGPLVHPAIKLFNSYHSADQRMMAGYTMFGKSIGDGHGGVFSWTRCGDTVQRFAAVACLPDLARMLSRPRTRRNIDFAALHLLYPANPNTNARKVRLTFPRAHPCALTQPLEYCFPLPLGEGEFIYSVLLLNDLTVLDTPARMWRLAGPLVWRNVIYAALDYFGTDWELRTAAGDGLGSTVMGVFGNAIRNGLRVVPPEEFIEHFPMGDPIYHEVRRLAEFLNTVMTTEERENFLEGTVDRTDMLGLNDVFSALLDLVPDAFAKPSFSPHAAKALFLKKQKVRSFVGTVECSNPPCLAPRRGSGITDLKRCAGCGIARYCTAECQKAHWKEHKKWCRRFIDF
ncbi:hypothetical protein M427DRAFT_60298 [Gonapodya prolifera JEL478]|uniref:MYND-type domain-containing protein n=1 Tax=Gonapodya prolifera (strain JEL478) TaxID=1344416 RepID=A0A139A4E3_GONPJ|nr:hypothetical protein M427DRAFT_60298 [Gonapodya prolifera JEL478]|eukprot:KXS11686.1 hypothetical protein M427DRAFT_60298 [Gonapodya prolifera JEL478]